MTVSGRLGMLRRYFYVLVALAKRHPSDDLLERIERVLGWIEEAEAPGFEELLVRIRVDHLAELSARAAAADHTVATEIRRAVRLYLEPEATT